MVLDLVVRGGRVVDGSGGPWFWGDVGVQGGRIVKIGRVSQGAIREVDASGCMVSPGWIDVHMHADHTVLGNPNCESYLHQGVTTATMGNCGLSMYPLHAEHKEELVKYLKPFTSGLDFRWDWTTLGDFISSVESGGTSLNLVPLVGHGSIRINVMGFDARDPTAGELDAMKSLLREALGSGAYGMSTGLGYPPGVFTRDWELLELCGVLKEYGGLYTTHMRGHSGNLEETIRLGEASGVPVQVSHLGSSCASYAQFSGRHRETTLRLIDETRSRGVDVTGDIYPYVAGSSLLSQVIPDWAHEGGVEKMLERIGEPETRARLSKEYAEVDATRRGRDFTKVMVTYVKSSGNKQYEGMTVAEIAEARGQTQVDALCDLLIEEQAEAMNVTFWGEEPDVNTIVEHPAVMPCSDGWIHAPYGRLGQGKPHPRCYGAFPRYLRRYVKEERLFTVEEAVRRMTLMPAQRLGLSDRGLLRVGMKADLTVFNMGELKDNASFDDPHRYPSGIPYVVVNGEVTIDQGEHTGAHAGEVHRKR